MKLLFWLAVFGVLYPYVGYPVVLRILAAFVPHRWLAQTFAHPSVSLIVPFHNEQATIDQKLRNIRSLQYPPALLEVLLVSDGSTDSTAEALHVHSCGSMVVIVLPERGGKAAALNAALARAKHEVLVFSDASIELQPDALLHLVAPLADPLVGCVSGEDRIGDTGGESVYGRYELMLRRLESHVGSIVGASGSFYAQRRVLCGQFVPNLAPDFLSVLRTVEQGRRAVSAPKAVGMMASVQDPSQEFARKVRTVVRGMTTLFAYRRLLNPFRFGLFSFGLLSHKVFRWLAPVFLLAALFASAMLTESAWYSAALAMQLLVYSVAVASYSRLASLHRTTAGRVSLYFCAANLAVLVAWAKYLAGVRQEIWIPSRR